jgi:hypothetical protein
MKSLKYLLILLFIVTACKSNKAIVETTTDVKKMASRKIVKKHLANRFTANTLESKIKVRYTNNRGSLRKRHQFTVRLRMKKDSVIWMRGNKAITVFKARITPESFSFYSPVSKEYFEGDYSLLEKMLGVQLTFSQLQDLLLGKSIFEMKGKRFNSEVADNSYKLTPKVQERLFDVFFRVNPKHFKLDQLLLLNEEKNQSLRINYKRYDKLKDDLIPTRVEINATEGEDAYTWINMEYRSLKLNEPIKLPFKIPSGYKRIEL